ncbi:MAG: lipopolysaccharide heptosyltransferase II [Gammaproteobacteria bacterium RIFCSPLOWO2_02_FULL_57_10]|nr:MAG: lipopolysaccharide heptosyltransferase II [Gammaproteobacteria bacterium RIFCSPLOWO2_02_FULL_57_10]
MTEVSSGASKKILIVGPSWVGDMVMAQALFITLQAQAAAAGGTAIIDVLAPAWSRPLLVRMPQVRHAIDLPFAHGELNLAGRYRLGHSLRKERYDQVIVLPNSFKSALLTLFTRSRKRTGWRGEARGILLNDVRQLDPQALPLMVQRFVALGLPEGASLPDPLPRPQLITDPASVALALADLQLQTTRPVLVICPGAEFGDAKQWPAEHFASLSARKIEDGWQVWILGSAKDNHVATTIKDLLSTVARAECQDLTGRTSLAQAIDLMSLARAVVSNDSGLMHVAAALARPIVALYGSTSADFTPPLADNVQLLATDIGCRPCFERTCPLQHKRCLVDLSPQLALGALEAVLNRAGSPTQTDGEQR